MTETFDLHAALTGRAYPTGKVRIWLDEEPWYELDALEKRHATLKTDDPEFKKNEKNQDQLRKQIESQAYTIHLRGISPRAGEDIISAALSEIPIRRDMYGRDDEHQQIKRNRLITVLSFAAHITRVVSPDGAEVDFSETNNLDYAKMILGEAPPSAIKTIDTGIAAVSKDFAEKQAKFTSPDFL